jgi:competence protein ComEA
MDPFPGDPLPTGWRIVEPAAVDRPRSGGSTRSGAQGASRSSSPDEQCPRERTSRFTRLELMVGLAALVAILAGAVLAYGPSVAPAVISADGSADGGGAAALPEGGVAAGAGAAGASATPAGASSTPAMVVVDVAGAVRRPGLYRLPPGSRVGDAIAAAGGYGPRVDISAVTASINLAERLEDGVKVLVPARGAAATAPAGPDGTPGGTPDAAPSPTAGEPGLIDLNRASQAELESLPGIGPVTARKIIDARTSAPFTSPEDLVSRGVVRAGVFDEIRDLVVAEP